MSGSDGQKHKDGGTSEFSTPLIKRVISVVPRLSPSPFADVSPFTSPRKGTLFSPKSPLKLSPVRTPHGRAGLPSPAKRSALELTNSAVKRAYKVKISSVLANEDSFDDTEELDRQDLEIAEYIINQSRNESFDSEALHQNVPFEIDSSETDAEEEDVEEDAVKKEADSPFVEDSPKEVLPKRGRGRPRKEPVTSLPEKPARKRGRPRKTDTLKDITNELQREDSDIANEPQTEDSELRGPRKTRLRRTKKTSYHSSDIEEDDSDEDVPNNFSSDESVDSAVSDLESDASVEDLADEPPVTTPTKKRAYRSRISQSPEKLLEKVRTDDEILSTFRQDDEFYKLTSPSKKDTAEVVKPKPLDFSKIYEQTTEDISMISGIPVTESEKSEIQLKKQFQPLPIPLVGEDGELPASYIKEHLSDIVWERAKDGEGLDDRAFFDEGTEGFFDQTSHRERHSVYLLSNLGVNLERLEFLDRAALLKYFKIGEKKQLLDIYKLAYSQWCFEASQGFNLCFYGIGSKLGLLSDFVSGYLVQWLAQFYEVQDLPKILVLNGYNPACRLKDVIEAMVSVLVPPEYHSQILQFRTLTESFPVLFKILNKLRNSDKTAPKLVLLVHGVDLESFRDEKTQVQLCQLANCPEIKLVCSTESFSVPLLWDLFKIENYKFVFHDITTYEPYEIESSYRDAISTNKSKRAASSRGAKFVLSALNENSKKIYRIILKLQIEKLQSLRPQSTLATSKGSIRYSIDFKELHQKCMAEFITSNEISFRAMLGEYVEHNMCKLSKNDAGVEKVYVGYTVEEMQKILRESFRA